ncbi:MAG: type II toxin-antitoxin system RelE/ParE family toxin [Terriglobales bacterium]
MPHVSRFSKRGIPRLPTFWAFDWYVARSGEALAKRSEKAATAAVLRVVERPASGTPCTFQSPELRGVRRTTISAFPKHLLFYKFDGEEVFVLRVAHRARDLERLWAGRDLADGQPPTSECATSFCLSLTLTSINWRCATAHAF